MLTTSLRNATLPDLAQVLKGQADARYDVVAHSSNLKFDQGNLLITDQEAPVLSLEGVTNAQVCLTPTEMFDSGLSQRLEIPKKYLSKMRSTGKADLLDHNVNTWMAESNKQWFVRGFKTDGDECGIARAFLSDRFGCIDNFDVLLAALQGVRDAGVDAKVVGADLSERKMSVRVVVPEVAALAPLLLADYRSPFGTGNDPDRARALAEHGLAPNGEPIIFAGFVISNSETGGAAFTITPRLTVLACFNGMQFTSDALRKVHLGGRMEQGLVQWSDATNRKQVELVTSQATDAVRTFCNVEYLTAKIAEVEEAAGIAVTKPTEVIEKVCKALSFTSEEAESILGDFITGGQMTAGGVLNAITSTAQRILDPDRADEIEAAGIPGMLVAARG